MHDYLPRFILVATAMFTIGIGAAADVTTTPHLDPAADVTYVRIQPPASLKEEGATSVTEAQAWIAGHWAWQNGAFFWRPGTIVPRPSPTARWQQGEWERVVTRHHGWSYRPGHWLG